MSIFRKELSVQQGPEVKDAKIADVGPVDAKRRTPAERVPQPNTTDGQAYLKLQSTAVDRALHFGFGIGTIPQVKYPNNEEFQGFPFEEKYWEKYGNVESERGRMRFMLNAHGVERAFPQEFGPYVAVALNGKRSVLANWRKVKPALEAAGEGIYLTIRDAMNAAKQPLPMPKQLTYPGQQPAYTSESILYRTDPQVTKGEKVLWEKALSQITADLQKSDYRNVASFLDLYTRIKDPVTPITSTLPEQNRIFIELFKRARTKLQAEGKRDITGEEGKAFVTQLALEASFLALPAAKDVFYVRESLHELPFVNVELDRIPRGEYTGAPRVVEVIEDTLRDTKNNGKPVLTPIVVSYFQTPGEKEPTMFIVDGNNRAATLMTLKFIKETGCTYENRTNPATIRKFMKEKGLHAAWERELNLTLNELSADLFTRITQDKRRLAKLAKTQVPAILVQETSFHTVQMAKSEKDRPTVHLLQPMHQAIYQQPDIAVGIPPKGQSHGRAKDANILLETTPRPRLGIRRGYKIAEQKAA